MITTCAEFRLSEAVQLLFYVRWSERQMAKTWKRAHLKRKAKGIQNILKNYGAPIWLCSFFSVAWQVSCSSALVPFKSAEESFMQCVEPIPRILCWSQFLRSTSRTHSRQRIWVHLILAYSGEWIPCSGRPAILDLIFKILWGRRLRTKSCTLWLANCLTRPTLKYNSAQWFLGQWTMAENQSYLWKPTA